MSTLEEEILLAVLNDDDARAEQLVSEMRLGELYRFGAVLERTRILVNRRFWEKKSSQTGNSISLVEGGREKRRE